MTCIACYLIVDEACPHCQALFERAKDFVELLKNRGCVTWNLSRWGFPVSYYDLVDNDGGTWLLKTPQLVVAVHGEGGDRVLYRRVLEVDTLPRLRPFILNDVSTAFHLAFRQGVKKCYEKRGRKKKAEGEGGNE